MYVRDVKTLLPDQQGQSFKVSNYKFTYQGIAEKQLPNGDVESVATFSVTRDGKAARHGHAGPDAVRPPGTDAARRRRALRASPRHLHGVGGQPGGRERRAGLSVNVKVNPLIWFAWGGFIILMLGSALAAWPRRSNLAAAPAPKPKSAKAA